MPDGKILPRRETNLFLSIVKFGSGFTYEKAPPFYFDGAFSIFSRSSAS